ncbi:MAG: hypothetical protein WC615_11715 [Mucilaginibacter sp.]|jgi:hypothetical protein|uniref:hypothetical protein n=1 Tax=Mucilaginibacter sp. TaxID=1882438 RepID=UPI0035631AB4
MKTKIFKHALLTVIAVLAISTSVSAQDSLAVPPMPPVKLKMKFKDDKAFKQNMADLKVKMKQLQRQMKQKNFKMDMKLAFKDFDKNFNATFKDFDKNFDKSFKDFGKNFNESFKDFGKNFSGSFSEMSPNFSGNLSLNGVNYSNNNNVDNEAYKQKVASGEMIEKVKNYSKSYPADGNDVLQIRNTFGKVVVNTWAKKEFKVDVQMKFSADDEDYVNNMIEGSSISDSKDGSTVSFRTNLANINNRHGSNHIEVNYTVYMPAGNALDLTNKFGNVILPDLSGKVTLQILYSYLSAQQLTNPQNDVFIKFSQDNISSIATFNGKSLRVEFSKFKAGIINNVNASFSFSDVVIDKLQGSNDITVKFGKGLMINGINKTANKITASNTKINLGFKDSFNFDVTSRFGSFKYDDKVQVVSKSPSDDERGWSQTKTYKGFVIKNSTNNITLNTKFTEVTFF